MMVLTSGIKQVTNMEGAPKKYFWALTIIWLVIYVKSDRHKISWENSRSIERNVTMN